MNPPTDDEIKDLVALIGFRVVRFLKKKGYFNDQLERSLPEEETSQDSLLPELQAASVQSKVGIGERKGQSIRRLGTMELQDFHPELKGNLCAHANGFSLHAAVYCEKWERTKLEQLCRYITRPAVAEERLSLRPNGDVVLRLKTKYSDGTSHLLFSGLEFVEKLAALVPPPRAHLTRFFGCLAPHAKIRSLIVPKREVPEVETCDEGVKTPHLKSNRLSWAELLARVFQIDVLKCPCGGEYKIIAAILETAAIQKILRHLKLPDRPPDVAPSRVAQQMTFT